MSEIGDVKYVINIIIIIWATPQNRLISKKTRQNSWKYFLKHVRTMYQGTVDFKLYSHPKIPLVPTIDFRKYIRVSKSLNIHSDVYMVGKSLKKVQYNTFGG